MAALDVALMCRKCEGMTDWYLIERAEHDGREWLEPFKDGYGGSLQCSSRIGNADIEGSLADMVALAMAIKLTPAFGVDAATAVSFKRCAVKATADGVLLWSPRNSDEPTLVTKERALALADQILAITP